MRSVALLNMTLASPQNNFSDRILSAFGKKRAMKIPEGIFEKFGPYAHVRVQKESFWRALLRPKGAKPPEGYFYADKGKRQY